MKSNIISKGVAGYATTVAALALALTFTPAFADDCNGVEYDPATQVCKENGVFAKAKGIIPPFSAKSIDMGSGDGARSKSEISKVVSENMKDLEAVYKKHLEKPTDFTGKVTLKFTIAPSGEIISIAIVSSTTGNAEFNEKVKSAVSKWKWKEIKSGNATATIPFNFE